MDGLNNRMERIDESVDLKIDQQKSSNLNNREQKIEKKKADSWCMGQYQKCLAFVSSDISSVI